VTSPARTSANLLSAAGGELEAVFDSLTELAAALATSMAAARAAQRRLKRRDVMAIRPQVKQHLRRHDALVAGTGVLTRPGLLGDVPMFVE